MGLHCRRQRRNRECTRHALHGSRIRTRPGVVLRAGIVGRGWQIACDTCLTRGRRESRARRRNLSTTWILRLHAERARPGCLRCAARRTEHQRCVRGRRPQDIHNCSRRKSGPGRRELRLRQRTVHHGRRRRRVPRGDGGALTPVFAANQLAPGGATFEDFSDPLINEHGQVAATALLTDSAGNSVGNGLFVGDGRKSVAIALEGQAAPRGGNYGGRLGFFAPLTLNERGEVGFHVGLLGGTSSNGIFRGDGRRTTTVAGMVGDIKHREVLDVGSTTQSLLAFHHYYCSQVREAQACLPRQMTGKAEIGVQDGGPAQVVVDREHHRTSSRSSDSSERVYDVAELIRDQQRAAQWIRRVAVISVDLQDNFRCPGFSIGSQGAYNICAARGILVWTKLRSDERVRTRGAAGVSRNINILSGSRRLRHRQSTHRQQYGNN